MVGRCWLDFCGGGQYSGLVLVAWVRICLCVTGVGVLGYGFGLGFWVGVFGKGFGLGVLNYYRESCLDIIVIVIAMQL